MNAAMQELDRCTAFYQSLEGADQRWETSRQILLLLQTLQQFAKLDRHILKLSLLETDKEPSMPCKHLCFLEHLLNMLRNHFVMASRDLLLAARTTPIHGVILVLRRCLLEEPDVVSSMLEAQKMLHWQLFFQRLVMTMRDISNLLLSVLQSNQASSTDQHASSPSFADMGNAIGSLIRLGKGLEEEEEDTVLLSEEHSLILTCCWVSVKVVRVASEVFQDILLKCRHWGAVEGCSVGFTKFCATLLSHPSPELQNIPDYAHTGFCCPCASNISLWFQPWACSATTQHIPDGKWSPDDNHAKDGVSPEAVFGRHVHLRSILLGELSLAVEMSVSEGSRRGKFHLCPSLYAVLTFLAKLQPSRDTQDSTLTCFLEPLIQLSGNPIYAVRAMAAKALVPFIPVMDYGKILLRLASRFPQPEPALSHNALHGCLLQIQAVLHPELLRSVACMMESHIWLLMDIRRCPLICAVYLQVLSLLLRSCSPGFVQQVWKLLYGDLASPKPGFSPIQLGSSIFCQWAVNFLSQGATRQESPERIHDLILLLQKGNPDVQVAVLTWLLDNEERKGLKSNKELQLIFMGKFKEILKNTEDPTVLKLYLKAFVHLFGNIAERAFPREISSGVCPEVDPLWERWMATVEHWSDSLSDEVLRMAAAKATKMGGPAWIWRAQTSSNFLLRSQVLRLIKAAIHLLQDEDQQVRHAAASFVSCLVQSPWPAQQVQPHNSCLQLQSSKALLSLLEFLLQNFGDHPSTFVSLMHLLPMVLLPFLLQLVENASTSRKLWKSIQSWLETTGAGIVSTIQFCRQWWSQAILVAHVLKILETQNQPSCTPGISVSSQELSRTIHSLKDLLRQRGIAIMVQMEPEQAGLEEN
ncbi:hypothetical protein E2320_012632 [Naja naja]|nr:hypothetical protein E2320_012632 [Naja naja]